MDSDTFALVILSPFMFPCASEDTLLIIMTRYKDTVQEEGGRTPRELMMEMEITRRVEKRLKTNTYRQTVWEEAEEEEEEEVTSVGEESAAGSKLRTAQCIGEAANSNYN